MADLSITATLVVQGAGAFTKTGVAGGTITAGQSIYADAANNGVLKPANALTSAATAACLGIALNGGATGQPIQYQINGPLTIGATVVAGALYVVSGANNGGIAPVADLTTGWITTMLCEGISTTQVQIFNVGAGVAHT